jgi:hypothetical protein
MLLKDRPLDKLLMRGSPVSRSEIKTRLRENIEKRARLTFASNDVQDLTVINVDEEGFVTELEGEYFWSTFDDVTKVEPLSSGSLTGLIRKLAAAAGTSVLA